jgi:hypothetical protein
MSEELNKEIAPEPVEEEIQEATVTATTREEIIARLQEAQEQSEPLAKKR